MQVVFLAGTGSDASGVALAIVAAAFAGAVISGFLRLPKVAGYVAAGAAIGPAGLEFIDDPDDARFAAEVGVAFLLFAVGLELSLRELRANLRIPLIVGAGQVLTVSAVVGVGASLLGFSGGAAFILAAAAGLSSTAVGLTLLGGPRLFAGIALPAIAILIIQDIVAVVLIGVVPTLTGGEASEVATLVARVLLTLLIVVPLIPIAAFVAQRTFHFIAARVDRELFLVGLMASIGLLAAGAAQIGLSVSLGAFVAGLVVSQSGFAHQAIRETEALRNAFMAAFFVSIGLLFDPAGAGDELGLLILLLVSVTVLKLAVTVGFARLAGLGFTAALPLALLLANAGEFSFVVVEVADDEVLGEGARQAMYFSVIVSLLLTSLLTAVISRGRDAGPVIPRRDSVVVIGYGGLGRAAAEELARRGIPHVVVESDGELAHLARTDGHPAVWGDARQRSVLRQLGPYATFLLTVRGDAASQLVEELANVAPGSRVLSQAIPQERLGSLDLDLTLLDVDSVASARMVDAVESARRTPPEPYAVRTRAGVSRVVAPAARLRPTLLDRLLGQTFAPRALGDRPCPACRGRGRRWAGGFFTRCSVCGGDGRR